MSSAQNPIGLQGIDFVEYASPDPGFMEKTFLGFGFSKLSKHREQPVESFRQNDIHFLLHKGGEESFAGRFAKAHGPSICTMGWRVENAEQAFNDALARGAEAYDDSEGAKTFDLPAIRGIGGSLIYFVDKWNTDNSPVAAELVPLEEPIHVEEKGFLLIDHLTNNVYKGTMEKWSNFYKDIFGFTEVRTFDIKGRKTGLMSYALQSPCKGFCIPINEGNEDKSQIEEYLRDYNGPGVQHLALLSKDLLASLDALEGSGIETLDIHPNYYEEAFQRVPDVTEDREHIKRHQVLVDGDPEGYLLQIFTKPVGDRSTLFLEIIQRVGCTLDAATNRQVEQRPGCGGFGKGNFHELFRAIEEYETKAGINKL